MIRLEHRYVDAFPELTAPAVPAPAPAPELVVLNEPLAAELGLDASFLRSPAGVSFLLGLTPAEGSIPVAMRYAGHQFGGYSPVLGDGRAMLLGEIETSTGLRDLHLKGSGPTGVGRGGDGLAALGPMLREYLVSEAMHALGVPTTRSLAVVSTGAEVYREDGTHPGAVLVRVAASHLRVGTFQFVRAADDLGLLERLVNFAAERHYPAAQNAPVPALALFDEVVRAQAALVARWVSVGFVHGVMNTDNVTLSGETIDYGPCAFLDAYSPATVFSSIDTGGRYAFGRQPSVTQWNLARFAEALLPAVAEDEAAAVELLTPVLEGYATHFNAAWLEAMSAKIGLRAPEAENAAAQTSETQLAETTLLIGLITDLHQYLEATGVDFTSFFPRLARWLRGEEDVFSGATGAADATEHPPLDTWLERWRSAGPDPDLMDRVNPIQIPRNHLLEEALSHAEVGDLIAFTALLNAVQHPFTAIPGGQRFAEPAPAEFTAEFRTFCGT